MKNIDMAKRYLLLNKVYVGLDMLGAPMLDRVRVHINRIDIIT
jgi:hypothetical protein